METIFMGNDNSKTREPHRFRLDLTDKLDLKDPKINMALANLSIYYTWKNIKSEYNNNKFKISAPTRNDTNPVKHLKLRIVSILQSLLGSPYKNEIFNRTEI